VQNHHSPYLVRRERHVIRPVYMTRYMIEVPLDAYCANLIQRIRENWNCNFQRATNTPNCKNWAQRKQRLRLWVAEYLWPRGSKVKVLKVKRNGSNLKGIVWRAGVCNLVRQYEVVQYSHPHSNRLQSVHPGALLTWSEQNRWNCTFAVVWVNISRFILIYHTSTGKSARYIRCLDH